ncbi:MAG: hypothetical protein DRQ35_01175 [Gammaproteobacteria bacterium]|nr:MAG: hypothetical protein DRQ35_01175 [Gammaproteobacteria bacterium]
MINLIVNGKPFKDFTEAECTVSITSMANDFSFTATSVNLFPTFKINDSVEVWVDDIKQMSGNIDEIGGDESEGSHTVTYSGRDKTSGIIDSQVIGFNDVRGDITLKKVVELILSNIGLDLNVVDNLAPVLFNAAEDVIDGRDGTNALGLAMEYGRKRQALISSDNDGNVCIEDVTPTESGATLQRTNGNDNNILSQSWNITNSELFNTIIHKGQLAPRSLNLAGKTDVATVESQGGTLIDSSVRKGRQKVVVEGKSYSSKQLNDRAKWTHQLSKAKSTTFNCTVKGHSKYNSGLWSPNSLVQINSSVADISRKMLIDTVTFSQGEGQPTITELEFVERNSYTIVKPKDNKKAGKQNDVYWR